MSWKEKNRALFKWMDIQRLPILIIFGLITLVGLVNIISALAMIIIDKTRQIGILKSLGLTKQKIYQVFLIKGLIIGLAGSLIGTFFALFVASIQNNYKLIQVPEDVYFMDFIPLDVNINNILIFQKDYDDVAMYRLEQNYRSTKTIVNAANSIINHNKTKIDKIVWTSNAEGSLIQLNRLATDAEEGRHVASSIFEFKMQEQRKNADFTILYRTNAQSRAMEDALRKRDIPYRTVSYTHLPSPRDQRGSGLAGAGC